ncbi:phosphotransferase family protein [Listeria costaricensis]|uniref:phosphotransferase family protein n=1 Tax=Listeria costaricensis TaxID=2026604 RepID=UPI000C08548E|nr:phosphotransferase family protein [Listeria costaricensis]
MKDQFFGIEYEISPAGGETGQAFIAIHEDEKFFLKRNSSPFLAALSVENIVPKLIWTRRVETGDVITAQKWINCHVLSAAEMTDMRVSELLRRIHHSKPLKEMLAKIEDRDFSARKLLERTKQYLPNGLNELETQALDQLELRFDSFEEETHVVCHGDINHNNWIISEENELFLVDWDEAMLADRATDISMFLYQYIDFKDWGDWLSANNLALTPSYLHKLKWFALVQTLYQRQIKRTKQEKYKLDQLLQMILKDER